MMYNRCTGIYKFGNNTYPWRIRCGSNLGHIFRGKKCVLRAGKDGISTFNGFDCKTLTGTISDNPNYHFVASCKSWFWNTQRMYVIKGWVTCAYLRREGADQVVTQRQEMNIKYDAIQRGVWVPCWYRRGLCHIWISQDVVFRIPIKRTYVKCRL